MPNSFEEYTSVLKGGAAPGGGSGGGSSFNSYISGAGIKAVTPKQQPQPVSTPTITPVPNKQSFAQKITSGIKTFGQNVSKEGLGGAIADLIVPKSKQQPQEVVDQNVKTFVNFQSINRPETVLTQVGLDIIKDKSRQFEAAGAATTGLINKNIFGTYNLTSREQVLLKERGYLDDKGNIKVGKTAVETAKSIGDLAIFFPQVFAPIEFISSAVSGGKVIRIAGQSIALSRIVEGAVIGGSYNTLYTPKLEDIFSDERIVGDAAKNFLVGSAIGVAISIPVEIIRNPGMALSTDVKSLKGTPDAYKALPVEQQIELKRVYLNLAKKYHPDSLISGNEEAFKEIVARYNKADIKWLEKLDKASTEEVASMLNISTIKPAVTAPPTTPKIEPYNKPELPIIRGTDQSIADIAKNGLTFSTHATLGNIAYFTDSLESAKQFGTNLIEGLNVGDFKWKLFQDLKDQNNFVQEIGARTVSEAINKEGKFDGFYVKDFGEGGNNFIITNKEKVNTLLKERLGSAVKTGIKSPKIIKTQRGGIVEPQKVKSEISKSEQEIIKIYKAREDEVNGALAEIFGEMETAEAGQRIFVENPTSSEPDIIGIKSSFPDWIPEDLRSKDLFNKVLSGIVNIDTLKYPDKNRTAQRALYDEILKRIDRRVGVDTSVARNAIIRGYEKVSETKPIKPKKSVNKRPKRTEKPAVKKHQEKVSRAEPAAEDLGFNPKNLEHPDSPAVSKETKKIIKRSEIAKQLSEKLSVPIRVGKFRRSALGIFKPGQKVVRIKGGGKSGGLPTIFHEVGHFIDSNLNISSNINIVERKALMEEYAYSYEGKPKLQQQEAFAEFLRFRMTGQTERASRLAPKFSKYFDEKMNDLPEIKEVLDTAAADYQRWKEQPASAKVLSQISIGKQPQDKLGSRVTSGLHKLYTIFLDDLHPLSQFSELAKRRGIKTRAEADPYILARTMRGWGGISDLFLNKGTFDPANYYHLDGKKPKMIFTGKSLSEILKPIARVKAEDDLRIFLTSKRVVEDLSPRKIKTGIDLQDAKNAIEEVKLRHPDIDFEKIGQEIIAYQDSLLKYAASPLKGLIGPEGLKKIKELNKYHVPFYRVMEELQSSGYMGKKKIAGNFGSPIKKMKGSEREIVDPLESLIKDTYSIINASERNSIGVAMANLSKLNPELGRLFEKVDSPMKATRVTGEEIAKGLAEKIGMEDLGDVDKETLDELAMTIFRPTQDRGQNMLNVNMGDKKLVFQVDPDLFNAIQGLNQEDIGLIMKVLSLPAKTLRLGATLSPDFSVRNPLRDTFSATIFSEYGFKPGIDLIKGAFDLVNPEGDVYNLWKAGGGQGSMFVSVDRQRLQENYKQLVATKGEKALNILKNPIELLRLSSEIGEEATRLGEMRNALVSGASPKQSAFASREVTLDFARVGAKTRALNMIKAFFNSQIQGTDKMIRAFKTHPFRSLLKSLLLLTLPTILLYFANRKDKRWKEIPQWQKDLFWIVLTKPSKINSSGIWRIPKPFEVGMLFASVPERVLEYMDTKNSDKLDALAATIMNGVLPDLTPIPSAGIPIVENMTNYSFFLERPIVSRGQENLPPEAQYGAYTSETAKIVGKALGYSPSKIDNLVQGYAGGLGNYATELLDIALKGTGIATPPPAPASDFENMPVLRAFTIRNPVGSSSESVNTVYKKYGQISVEMNYVTKLAKGGEEQKAIDYVKKHPEVINAPLLNDTITTFSAINKKIDEIRKSKDLTPREKKDLIDRLGQAQTDLAENVLEQLKSE